jgi:hypothetical protein
MHYYIGKKQAYGCEHLKKSGPDLAGPPDIEI